MITDLYFYLAAIPAVLIVGISKGGMGGGLGILAVPIMSLVISPFQAAAIMLPILCVMDLVGLWGFRGTYDKTNLKVILPAAVVGIVFGAFSFHYLSEAHIKLLIGAIAVLFTVNYWGRKIRRKADKKTEANTLRGGFWGTLAGFTSFSVHAGGPPINIYLLPQQMDKTLFAGTTVIFFAVVNFTKLVPYSMLGLLEYSNLMTSLALVALAPVGVYLGIYLHHRINEFWFYLICYGLLFLTGMKLSYEGINELLFV
ncbi:MAG: sulfite exporter TauE/SafE family protein [Motiliproteus sp.]|nr:sulfite exporter TauE/SafE family protein [Motiliproteus sp.]MCW9052767.1 sulfite exporter TauE/SafE family protein [Motiliproteus sp.]